MQAIASFVQYVSTVYDKLLKTVYFSSQCVMKHFCASVFGRGSTPKGYRLSTVSCDGWLASYWSPLITIIA